MKVKYKKGLELERNERDGTKKFKIRLKNQRLKARIDQIHYQIIDKKRLKNLQTYWRIWYWKLEDIIIIKDFVLLKMELLIVKWKY